MDFNHVYPYRCIIVKFSSSPMLKKS